MTRPEAAITMKASELEAILEDDGVLVLDRLRHWASRDGSQPCLMHGDSGQRLSYAEFDALTDDVAGNLAALGVGKGDPVSVYLRNQYVSIIAMVGIWKAGAVFAPVNFNLEGQLLHYQLDDTQPVLLITEQRLFPALAQAWSSQLDIPRVVVHGVDDNTATADSAAPTLPADVLAWESLTQPAPRPDIQLAFDDIANIIYTSGTTGPAKGVVQRHRWMNHYTFMFRQVLDHTDVVYNDLPMYHVGGAIFNIVRAFWAGSSMACWDRFSPHRFWDRIRQSGATSAVLIDTMISWLAKAPASDTDNQHTLRKVHMQPLPEQHHEISRRFGFDFVTCGFGQTESGLSCYAIIEETDSASETPAAWQRGRSRAGIRQQAEKYRIPVIAHDQAASVGRGYMGGPSLFVEVAVLDDRDRHCRPGEVGELAFRPRLPAIVMKDYLGKPEATAHAFRNLWFHTGDSAVQTKEGTFYFNDRMGDRIRVRGENTSSFHIEDLINQCPGVAMSAAFGVPAAEGFEDDVAVYVVAHGGTDPVTESFVHEWASQNMPKFMRPAHVRIVDDLPRTLTQKVEKFRLKRTLLDELGRVVKDGAAG